MSAHGAEAALARFFADGAGCASTPDHDALWAARRDAADGGKRVRPVLLTTVYEALGGTDDHVVAEVAAALELLHTAFVVHDDVIDADTVRRGRPNVSGTFAGQARRAGLPAAREAVDAVAHLPVAPRLHDWVATVMAEARSAA